MQSVLVVDAACVGPSTPSRLYGWQDLVPLAIRAERRQRRQMCLMNEQGFPRTTANGASRVQGFKTGDLVKAVVPRGKPKGTHVGKVAVKVRGLFTVAGVPDVPARYCRLLQHADGYIYATGIVVGQAPRVAMKASSPNLRAVALMQATTEELGAQQSKKGERAFLPIP